MQYIGPDDVEKMAFMLSEQQNGGQPMPMHASST